MMRILLLCGFIFLALSSNGQPEVKVAVEIQASLGEGAIWNYEAQKLLWIDINKGMLYAFDPSEDKNESFEIGKTIGTVVPYPGNEMVIVALVNGIYNYNLEEHSLEFLTNPIAGNPDYRFNDGKCDPAGRFWVGSMHMKSPMTTLGKLYRIHQDEHYEEILDGIQISNGIIWSNDTSKMYYVDSPKKVVYSFNYDYKSGRISNKKEIIKIPKGMGVPDGITIDEEGNIWSAQYGGYCVVQWNPNTGELMTKIDIPAPNVTSCAFGGEDLAVLYITTASQGMTEKQLSKYPKSGSLFSAVPGVKGIKANFCKVGLD